MQRSTRSKPLADWLGDVIDGLRIHGRAGWGRALGVTEQAIGQWIAGKCLPRAENLRGMLVLLRERYPAEAAAELRQWEAMSDRPLGASRRGRKGAARSIGHYVVGPLWEDLRLAVESQPSVVQESILSDFIAQTNRRRSKGPST